MKKEYAEKWSNALSSQQYEQGFGFLNKEDKFCCLGVLCDIVKNELGVDWIKEEHFEGAIKSFGSSTSTLPEEVMALTGVKNRYGALNSDIIPALIFANDVAKLSFAEISQIIKERWEEL